ncbi:enos interacting domain containg protein [Babesia ovata]|uniref:Enos interacting domain containg protein n=1 Tax=Babesia ovata TaxID=189622 RepID=A0A2H6KF64_9APIC|nr:enos interacting domain containg protein [Babesia ovata]GBE61614.1 enos interacting domain containg protein [Babesia ovata]
MTRHSKHNTGNAVFTYHERKKVKDFNTLRQRLGADSMRKCEHCWLCLSTAVKPVCTPAGYVFCKECILKCCAKQLEDHKREVEEWNAQLLHEEAKKAEEFHSTQESLKRKLVDTSVFGVSTVKSAKRQGSSAPNDREKAATAADSNFWVSTATRQGDTETKEERGARIPPKPKPGLKCPITGKPLKIKDLVEMNPDTEESDDPASGVTWVCSVSQQPISHNPVLLDRKTGKLVLRRYVKLSNAEEDGLFIELIPGGTGFAAHNGVMAKKYREALL